MSRFSRSLQCATVAVLLLGAGAGVFAAPVAATNTIKLTRDKQGNGETRDIKQKQQQATKDQQSRTAGDLKLPPAVINIEDQSSMLLIRSRTQQQLLPDLDQGSNRTAAAGSLTLWDYDTASGRKAKQTISSIELLYGTYDALTASVSTGKEYQDFFYQVSYLRQRDEGFNKDGDRVSNSLRGTDDLHLDFGWTKDSFEASSTVRFFGRMTGLQTNAFYSQSRKNGLSFNLKSSLIFSTVANMNFVFSGSRGQIVLDNPTNRFALDDYATSAKVSFSFNWPKRRYLQVGMQVRYEKFASDQAVDSVQQDFQLFAKGGFSLGNSVSIALGSGMKLVDFSELQMTPSLTVTLKPWKAFHLLLEAERSVEYLDFQRGILDAPYALYQPLETPEKQLRFGGGVRFRPSESMVFSAKCRYHIYDSYYIPAAAGSGLYSWQLLGRLEMLQLEFAFRYYVHRYLNLRVEYLHSLPEQQTAYLAESRLRSTVELTVPSILARIGLTAEYIGARDGDSGALDGYLLLNLRLEQGLSDSFALLVQLDNLLDSDYRLRSRYLEPGITLRAGLSIRF